MYHIEGEIFVKVVAVKRGCGFAVDLRKHVLHKGTFIASPVGVEIPWSVWEDIVESWPSVEACISGEDTLDCDYLPDSKLKLTVKKFRGSMYIDVRDYFVCNGVQRPTKRGITLGPESSRKLKDLFDQLQKDKDTLEIFG